MAREAKPTGEPGWTWRRSVLIGIIALSFWLLWVIITGPESRMNESIAPWLVLAIISSGFIYGGFAAVQDVVAIWVTKSGLPYSSKSSPAEPTPNTPAADAPKEE